MQKNIFNWAYLTGFFLVLALPVLVLPPYFWPPDWGKTIVFRFIMAILLFIFAFHILFKKNEINFSDLKKNKIIWAISALFIVYLLASIFSVDPLFSFWGSPYRGGGFVDFAFYFVFAILAFIVLKQPENSSGWKKIWSFSIAIGALVSLVAAMEYFGLFSKLLVTENGGRPSATMGNPILLAIYIMLLFFVALSFAIEEKGRDIYGLLKRIFYFACLVLFFYAILISETAAVYLGIFAGAIYFLLFYPKKMKALKITTICLAILAVGVFIYASTINKYPEFLQQNKLFNSIISKVSINVLLKDPRLYTWAGIDYKILANKPVLGYGPENFSVGFDKYYDPAIPYLTEENGGNWWDRAHNIILQTGSDAGILGIIAYLSLFIILFWQLHKKKSENGAETLITHAVMATLIAYFVANFFSFDSTSSYLVFFLLIGYSLHLTQSDTQTKVQINSAPKETWWKYAVMFVLFCGLIVFLWQYNIVPLQKNAEINASATLASKGQCSQAFDLMDNSLQQRTFLDSYSRMQYVEMTKVCANFYPQDNLDYIKKDIGLMGEAVKIQPLYTRYWLYLGAYETVLAGQQTDAVKKNDLIKRADDYFKKALELAPKHQEIFIDLANLRIVSGDYEIAKKYSEKCVELDPSLGKCYFYLGLSELYLKDNANANRNLQTGTDKGFDSNSKNNLELLGTAYNFLSDYKDLAVVFEKLTAANPGNVQYHSSLAFIYKELGEYGKARQEAMKTLKISPESKQNVDKFLEALPY